MKQLKAAVTYSVPSWAFCNSDDLSHAGEMTGMRCQFCVQLKVGYKCMLHNKMLSSKGKMVEKLQECLDATAGISAEIIADRVEAPQIPTIPPKDLMKQTLDMYTKTVNSLLAQGYPRPMAESVARKFTLGD